MLGSLLGLATSTLGGGNPSVVEKGDAGSPGSVQTTTPLSSPGIGSEEVEKGSNSPQPSWTPAYQSPPPVKAKYKPEEALDDLPGVCYALQLFLESHMLEAEEYCHKNDKKKERLYFATGFGLIQCVKGLMSYEDDDLVAGLAHTRQGNHIADLHRKKQAFLGSRVAGYVVSAIHSNPVAFIKSMTPVERHAELVYAESLFEKALLGIVYSGDWLAFIKEALNMRTTITIYRQLGQYLDTVDAEAAERGEGPIDKSIDPHFRSGVYLGVGLSNLILSLMPGKLMTLVELFGYHGDRKLGLEMLAKAGGWTKDSDEPSVPAAEEGIRRVVCDMVLMIFHLVISSFTFDGVDVSMARKILDWNLKRFPNGVFFLFGAGRLAVCRAQPERAIHYYTRAMESQSQYRNLHHISYWEMALANMSLWDVKASLECWRTLEKEATWSKAIYTYGLAICMLEVAEQEKNEDMRKEAAKLMKKVPDLRQKIAGKSIPLEKLVARKARKFESQKGRLALPVLELTYIFQGIQHSPGRIIVSKILPETERVLAKLEACAGNEKKYEGGSGGYWDDYCIAKFLQGVCLRYVAYPDQDAEIDPNEKLDITKEDAERRAEQAFRAVFEHGPKIEFDHHIVYHAHYELGRLLACQGKVDEARHEFELVLSGKHLEVGPSGKKGKYSLENALHMRTHAANDALSRRRL
ncbi:Inclusion body clearance protein IML2 [Coprinopsis cinerea AmutBmut pab1-1]|nr:Inclusion body clearance protein IML2 [Coprinopsis cinerea AmutBmut pab1-1]